MKRIAALLAVVVIFFLGDRLLALALNQIALRSQTAYSRLYRGGQQNDVLIFGDSRGSCTCSTPLMQQTLDRKCLNLSHNYLGIGVAERVFLDYLDHNACPKMLVMEVSNLTTNTWGSLDNLKPYWRYSPRLSQAAGERFPTELAGSRFSHLYGFNSEMFLRILYHLGRTDQDAGNSAVANPAFVGYVQNLPPNRLGPLPADRVASLQRILAEADRRGIEVRLFVSPILPAYREKIVDFEEWFNSLQESLGSKHQIWDFSNCLSRSEAFVDRVHVNDRGARLLLDEMISSGFFSSPKVNGRK